MAATARQIADFVERSCSTIPRANYAVLEEPGQLRPPPQALAKTFLDDVEFEALQLGRLLSGPDGPLIEAGVDLVFPPFAAADTKLIIDALTLAAAGQARRNRVVVGTGLGLAALWCGKLAYDIQQHAA